MSENIIETSAAGSGHATKLDSIFRKLESGRGAILADLQAWPEPSLSQRPAPDVWSALDIIEHIIKLEQDSVSAAARNLPDGHAVSIVERIKAKAVTSIMLVPSRIKVVPVAAFTLPAGQTSLNELKSDWQSVRTHFQSLIRNSQPITDRGVYLHPIVGWISMPNLVKLLAAHQQHHVFQLNRLRKALKSA